VVRYLVVAVADWRWVVRRGVLGSVLLLFPRIPCLDLRGAILVGFFFGGMFWSPYVRLGRLVHLLRLIDVPRVLLRLVRRM